MAGRLCTWATGANINEASPARWGDAAGRTLQTELPNLRNLVTDRISAESSSVYQYRNTALRGDDHLVLLASDTAEGVLAALINAHLLGGAVTYRTYPPSDGRHEQYDMPPGSGSPSVEIVRIAGLVPRDTSTFTTAMELLARTINWALHWGDGAVVMLTGGYKATVPYLAVLAEYAKAQDPTVKAFCLHEGDRTETPPLPIEIYLRNVSVTDDKLEIDAAREGTMDRMAGRLRGFAYEYNHETGKDKLTPLGYAISAFLR